MAARAAAGTAVVSAVGFNLAFIRPYGAVKVDAWEDWVALGVFLAVALVVGLLVAAEADRRRAAETREAEVRGLYERLRQADEERARLTEKVSRMELLKRVDEQRSALLRSVSHDLRTPLATIRAVASDLRDGVVYEESTRDRAAGDGVRRGRAARPHRGQPAVLEPGRGGCARPRPPGGADRRAGGGAAPARWRGCSATSGSRSTSPSDMPLVDGDYTQLEQVVTNLLENAGRHAPPGSVVRIGGAPPRLGRTVRSRSGCPTRASASPTTSANGRSSPSGGARAAGRAASAWPSARRWSRPTAGPSGPTARPAAGPPSPSPCPVRRA